MGRARRTLRRTVAIAPLLVLAVACADDGDEISDPIDVAEVGVTAMGQADVAACQTDRATMQAAVDAYTALNGGPPPSEAALVGDWLREESALWDLDASGTIVPAPGAAC